MVSGCSGRPWGVGEDRVVKGDRVTVGGLLVAPAFQDGLGGGVEIDAAPARAGLDGSFDRAAADGRWPRVIG